MGGSCAKTMADGSVMFVRKERTCSFDEWQQYVREFDTRIEKVMLRLDKTVPRVMDDINNHMRSLVTTHLLRPIDEVVDGVTCNFLGEAYHGMIDGLCFQSVVGFKQIGNSYVLCAILSVLLLVI